jgi:hypothetical protein
MIIQNYSHVAAEYKKDMNSLSTGGTTSVEGFPYTRKMNIYNCFS